VSSSNRPSKSPAGAKARSARRPDGKSRKRSTPKRATSPRRGEARLLSQVELAEDEVLIDAFDATLDGVRVRVTAVLERTCVYVDSDGDRRLARKTELVVEADKLPIRRRSAI
jgi:hypothetical protein